MTYSTSGSFAGTIAVRVDGVASSVSSSYVSVRGTKEHAECSNHGTCDHSTGICSCFKGYGSSNGLGAEGTRGDCGFEYVNNVSYHLGNRTVYSACPYTHNLNSSGNASAALLLCGGHGTCNHTTGVCSCYSGYGA